MPEGSAQLEKQPKKKRAAPGARKKPQAKNPSTGKPASEDGKKTGGKSKPLPSESLKGMFDGISRHA